ncbi:MAG: hypothetical protein R3C59_24395 [Planctomycetaceae bacterium]
MSSPKTLRQTDLDRLMIFHSQVETARRREASPPKSLADLEYSLFSQFGDDGIIEYVGSKIPSEFHSFIEFGVEDYKESNTRLLMQRDNWRGLVMDGSEAHIQTIRSAPYFWRHDLEAVHAFITRDNINDLISSAGYGGKIGILHIDVDGVDYWIWKAITTINPLVVICEYNSIFGDTVPITVPYSADFSRMNHHHSGLYAGASLAALVHLATQKGLQFLGANSAGNNAYFAHPDLNLELPIQTARSGYVRSKFREARDVNGQLLHKTAHSCIEMISHLPVVNVVTGEETSIAHALEI